MPKKGRLLTLNSLTTAFQFGVAVFALYVAGADYFYGDLLNAPLLENFKDIDNIILLLLSLFIIESIMSRHRQRLKTEDIQVKLEVLQASQEFGKVEMLDMDLAFPQYLVQSVRKANEFINDTTLSRPRPSLQSDVQADYKRIRDKRVLADRIEFRRVEVIFHQEALERIMLDLITFEGHRFLIRHYDPPPRAIPIIHLMSFDNNEFYLGGFRTGTAPDASRVLYIQQQKVTQLLKEYWTVLWEQATPLNEGGRIEWTELKRIARERFNMDEDTFEALRVSLEAKAKVRQRGIRRGI